MSRVYSLEGSDQSQAEQESQPRRRRMSEYCEVHFSIGRGDDKACMQYVTTAAWESNNELNDHVDPVAQREFNSWLSQTAYSGPGQSAINAYSSNLPNFD